MSISRVATQAVGITQDTSATVQKAFTANVTAGNLIVVGAAKFIAGGAAFVAGDCTKSAGTATIGSVSLDEVRTESVNAVAGVWSAIVTGSGSLTIQVSGATGSFWAMGINEYASTIGWDSARLYAHTNGTGNSNAPLSGNMTSATGVDGLFVGCIAYDASGTLGVPVNPRAGYTTIYSEIDGSLHEPGHTMDKIVTSANTDAVGATHVNTAIWEILGVVYKEAAGGSIASKPMAVRQLYVMP